MAAALALGGCTVTVENDGHVMGGNGDRWYTAGWRVQRDIAAESADPDRPWPDAVTTGIARDLQLIPPHDGPAPLMTVSLVAGQQIYTPDDISSSTVVQDDRPYAGWLYAGVARYDTWLDADATARRDVEHMVELDLGVVGPASGAEQVQDYTHEIIDEGEPQGWDHQLADEPGIVLRASRSAREVFGGDSHGGGLGWDLISSLSGAVGNVDTHAAGSALVRVGFTLPRSFDIQSGDRSLLAPDASFDAPTSIYLFAGAEGRLVLHNIFLDGNTFKDSHDIEKENLVGKLRLGAAWQSGGFRAAYTWTVVTDEFEGQGENQSYGSVTVGWSQRF